MNSFIDNVYVINMDKDIDRLDKVTKECNKFNIKFQRFPGVNPKTLSEEEKNKYITKFCQKYCTDGMMGCGLSHFKIYEDVINKNYNNVLILEDDVYFEDDFHSILNNTLEELPNDYDILYIGCFGLSSKDTNYNHNYFLKLFSNKKTEKNSFKTIFCPEFPLGTHAMIISNKGCKKLLEIIKKINYHIDFQISLNNKDLNIYATNKKIVNQLWEESCNSNMSSFPKYPNTLLNNINDNNKVPYSYIFNLSIIKICNINIKLWHIIIFILGLLNIKYLNLFIIVYFIIDFDFNSFLMFFGGILLNILFCYKLFIR
jgi:GR25 family glycosyltransferase involved in LPS biosynthesis